MDKGGVKQNEHGQDHHGGGRRERHLLAHFIGNVRESFAIEEGGVFGVVFGKIQWQAQHGQDNFEHDNPKSKNNRGDHDVVAQHAFFETMNIPSKQKHQAHPSPTQPTHK